jgi:hypothetical protein
MVGAFRVINQKALAVLTLLAALTRAILLLLARLLTAALLSRLLAGLIALLLLARLLIRILVLRHFVFLQHCCFYDSKGTFESLRPIK